MANPVKSDASSIANGKTLFTQHCQSCHGKKGKGDGPKAAQLDTECGDFTTADFQKQSDGAIFYKTSEGRKDMPSFKKKIPEQDDIWAVVNYVRTLK
jgi:mono/diheme cytochrome c family protein